MKRYVSSTVKTIAAVWMASPILYAIALGILFDIPLQQFVRVLISPLYFLIAGVGLAAGYGLWEMFRWGWYVFVLSQILFIYGNLAFGWDYGTSHHKGAAFALAMLFQSLVVLRISREIRVPWFYPKIRWWENDPRYKLSVPSRVVRIGGHESEGEILDISQGGCFVKIRTDLLADEVLKIRFTLFGVEMACDGFVVWKTPSTVTHPKGVGIKFSALGKSERRSFKVALRRLRRSNVARQRERAGLSDKP